MRRNILTIVLLFTALNLIAQDLYWLKIKKDYRFSDKRTLAVSENSFVRKQQRGIELDHTDYQLNQQIIAQLKNFPIEIRHQSRWLNAISFEVSNSNVLEQLQNLAFVEEITPVVSITTYKGKLDLSSQKKEDNSIFGQAETQLLMCQADFLFERNLTGVDITIAVMDAGFNGVDILGAFAKLRDDGRLKYSFDFVHNEENVHNNGSHGTNVLSTMAAYLENEMVGSAINANYYLFVTENGNSESRMEEDNWVAAAERADSLGVDILNTSLGYSTFDDSSENYTYADMDGNTTVITRAADIAASKGILVVNSAGNEGNGTWRYITAPADGDSVLTVGAVNGSEQLVGFSSRGPTADGDLKPNVVAMGSGVSVVRPNGSIVKANGTSFSAPLIAGMAASLWQAFPSKSSFEIYDAIQKSAHLYMNPNNDLGHGIPNFRLAYELLLDDFEVDSSGQLSVWPNPAQEYINIAFIAGENTQAVIQCFDSKGKILVEKNILLENNKLIFETLKTDLLQSGEYIIRVKSDQTREEHKFIKL